MRRLALMVPMILAIAVAACGGNASSNPPGGGGGQTTPAGPGGGGGTGSESDLETAARALFTAFQERDDGAYFAGLAVACRSSAGFGTVSERNTGRVARIRRASIDLTEITVTGVQITEFDGSSAKVALDLAGTDGNEFLEGQPNPWIYEDDGWYWANCDAFASGGGGGGVGGTGPEDPIGVGFVPTIADWYVWSTYLDPTGNDLVIEGGNPGPPPGTAYFLWSVSVTYNGPNASATLSDDMSFRFVAGGTTYDDPSDCGEHPGSLDLGLVAAPGEGQQGDICHAVATGDAGSLFLVVTEKATGTDYWFGQE